MLAFSAFVLAMAFSEAILSRTRWSARAFYFSNGGWNNPAYSQVVGGIEKNWAADFKKNSLSLRGSEPVHPLVIALGDSCTAGCYVSERETYVGRLTSRNVEVLNAGAPGYSSFQGLAWVRESRILDFHPKLVTIYYGWNDHWRAALPEHVFYWLRLIAPYSHLAAWLVLRYQITLSNIDARDHRYFAHVPLWEYKYNLRELVRLARAAGAVPVLITAPFEFRRAPSIERMKNEGHFAEFMAHDDYVRATREVAAETGAGLVDFAAEYERRKTGDPNEFFGDFVHPNAKGHAMLAEMLRPWVECSLSAACPPRA